MTNKAPQERAREIWDKLYVPVAENFSSQTDCDRAIEHDLDLIARALIEERIDGMRMAQHADPSETENRIAQLKKSLEEK